MDDAVVYFRYTALSYPFIALYNSSAAIYRSEAKSRVPMIVSVISNVINVIGNAVLIFGFQKGILGAAVATLVSRIFSAIVMTMILRRPGRKMVVRGYATIRPDFPLILAILSIGIPNGMNDHSHAVHGSYGNGIFRLP